MLFRKKRRPIIFLHGILGSMGKAIFKGQGKLNFGMAEIVYRPIIQDLKRLGYKEDRDLFICYYDWTKENIKSVENYLIPMIKKVKEKTESSSIDIIAHSMGGIVARTYAQGKSYDNDINKLIMIGTPNLGAANAYYFWSGGDLVAKDSYKNILYKIIKNSFLWYINFQYKKAIDMDFVRGNIPSVEELLPSEEYGDYLILEDTNEHINIEQMNVKNRFLNRLNKERDILKERNIKIYNIIGKNIDTIKHIKVRRQNSKKETWKDGKPIKTIDTLKGDGTVTSESAMVIEGENIYIASNHTDILSNCQYELAKILGIERRNIFKEFFITSEKDYDRKEIIYSIIAENLKHINIDGDRNTYEIISKGTDKNVSWAIVKAQKDKEINLNVESAAENGRLIVYKGNTNTQIIEEKNINIKDIGIQSIKL